MNTTKNILIFYSIVLVCVFVSASGAHLLDKELAKIYLGVSFLSIPILTIITIIISTLKSSKS